MLCTAIGRCAILGALACAQLALLSAPAAGATGAWEPNVEISVPGGDADVPQVAVDTNGNAFAIWQRSNGANVVVQSAMRAAGGRWQAPVDLSVPGADAVTPTIDVGADGEVMAAWQRFNGVHNVVQVAIARRAGAWQRAIDVSGPGGSLGRPELALDGRGGAIVVWDHPTDRSRSPSFVVQAAARSRDGSWQAPIDLSGSADEHRDPDVAIDPTGRSVAIWSEQGAPGADGIQARLRPTGETWQPPVTVSPWSSPSEARVVMDPRGNAIAVWSQNLRPLWHGPPGLFGAALAADLPAGGTWQAPVFLNDRSEEARSPRLAFDAGGRAVAVWLSEGSTLGSVRRAGEAWQPPAPIALAEGAYGIQLAVTPSGDAVAVWQGAGPNRSSTIRASVSAHGGAWGPPVTISGMEETASAPRIAIDPRGEAVAVWTRRDGASTSVRSSTFRVPRVPPPAPVIAGLRLSRAAFHATRSGPAVRATPRSLGSRVTYTLSAVARVRFTVLRATEGRWSGRRCVALTAGTRRAGRCDRFVAVRGGFTRARLAGADNFTLSGRVGGRTLRPGRYRLTATPTAAGVAGTSRHVGFRIVPRGVTARRSASGRR